MGQPEPRPGRRLLPRSGAPPGNKRTDERLAKSTQAPASAQNQALQSLDLTRKDSKKPKPLPVHSPAAVSRLRAHSAQTTSVPWIQSRPRKRAFSSTSLKRIKAKGSSEYSRQRQRVANPFQAEALSSTLGFKKMPLAGMPNDV